MKPAALTCESDELRELASTIALERLRDCEIACKPYPPHEALMDECIAAAKARLGIREHSGTDKGGLRLVYSRD